MNEAAGITLTISEYKQQERLWKAKPFNFRGNPDNKAFIQEFARLNGFANEGLALDYIVKSFLQANALTQQLTFELENAKALIAQQQADCVSLQAHAETANELLRAAKADLEVLQDKELVQLKERISNAPAPSTTGIQLQPNQCIVTFTNRKPITELRALLKKSGVEFKSQEPDEVIHLAIRSSLGLIKFFSNASAELEKLMEEPE